MLANQAFEISNSCPLFITQTAIPAVEPVYSGLYKLQPGKLNDTIWASHSPGLTQDEAIPEPGATLFLAGDE
jgi:hypothetical protein